MFLYIARDSNWWDEDIEKDGEIHLFYDTPLLDYNKSDMNRKGEYIWNCSRMIGEVPSYMFPELKEKECKKLLDLDEFQESFNLITKK